MDLNIIKLFCLLLAIALCKSDSEEYSVLNYIRDDYCVDYCANECTKGIDLDKGKSCFKNENVVVTDKFRIELENSQITLEWKTSPVNLEYLKMLNIQHHNFKADKLKVVTGIWDNKLVPSMDYMRGLNIKKINNYELFVNSGAAISESFVDVNRGPTQATITSTTSDAEILNNYLSINMKDLTDLKILIFERKYKKLINFHDNTFVNNSQLERIEFKSVHFQNLKPETFDFLNLKKLSFDECVFPNDYFFSSPALQNNLESIEFNNNNYGLNVRYFESYKKLQYIQTFERLPEISNTNITAFVRDNYSSIWTLNRGINGKRCPSGCSCYLGAFDESLTIECNAGVQSEKLELPIPILNMGITLMFNNVPKVSGC